jgi:hypothetical protein
MSLISHERKPAEAFGDLATKHTFAAVWMRSRAPTRPGSSGILRRKPLKPATQSTNLKIPSILPIAGMKNHRRRSHRSHRGRRIELRIQLITVVAAAGLASLLSCNDAQFSGGDSAPAGPAPHQPAPSAAPAAPTATIAPTSGECVDNGKVNFNWSGPAKECIVDQGKTFNFDTGECAEMRKAKFDCTWDNVVSELKKRGLLTPKLETDSKVAKLVSCGQSSDGNRIAVQWVNIETGTSVDCQNPTSVGHITTGCYTYYTGSNVPPAASTPEDRAKQVYDCLNTL